jgi:hypothetical protein
MRLCTVMTRVFFPIHEMAEASRFTRSSDILLVRPVGSQLPEKEGDTLPSLFGTASPTRAVLDLLCKGCLNCAMVTCGSIKRRLQLKLQVHPCIRLRFVAFPKSPSYYIVRMHGMSTPGGELQAIRRLSSSFKDYNPSTSNGPNLVPIPPAYIRDARYQGDAQ